MSSSVTPPQTIVVVKEMSMNFDEIPLTAIRSKSREKMSSLLNTEKVFRSEGEYARDWRGIFSLSGLDQSDKSLIEQNSDKMGKLLDVWIKRNKEEDKLCSLSVLQQCFGIIDRYDVYDDTSLLFADDAKAFLSRARDTTTSSSMEIVQADRDNDIITVADLELSKKNLPVKQYDAFVMYNDKDVEFALEQIKQCEDKGYSLCEKDRDLLGGISMGDEDVLNIVANRCRRVIFIVSRRCGRPRKCPRRKNKICRRPQKRPGTNPEFAGTHTPCKV